MTAIVWGLRRVAKCQLSSSCVYVSVTGVELTAFVRGLRILRSLCVTVSEIVDGSVCGPLYPSGIAAFFGGLSPVSPNGLRLCSAHSSPVFLFALHPALFAWFVYMFVLLVICFSFASPLSAQPTGACNLFPLSAWLFMYLLFPLTLLAELDG